ncbi:MAG: hypothetical protein ACLTSX_02790, partial [Collinsella sp.]
MSSPPRGRKTLRGPRAAARPPPATTSLPAPLTKAVFPGHAGRSRSLMHVIAGKAVAFLARALRPEFRAHIDHVVENAAALGEGMAAGGHCETRCPVGPITTCAGRSQPAGAPRGGAVRIHRVSLLTLAIRNW